jgi:hypothetical protein
MLVGKALENSSQCFRLNGLNFFILRLWPICTHYGIIFNNSLPYCGMEHSANKVGVQQDCFFREAPLNCFNVKKALYVAVKKLGGWRGYLYWWCCPLAPL